MFSRDFIGQLLKRPSLNDYGICRLLSLQKKVNMCERASNEMTFHKIESKYIIPTIYNRWPSIHTQATIVIVIRISTQIPH